MIMTLAFMRGAYVMIEQPKNSLLYWYPAVRTALVQTGAKKLMTYLGAYGAAALKPIELWTTIPRAHLPLQEIASSFRTAQKRIGNDKEKLTYLGRRTRCADGKAKSTKGWTSDGWVTGVKGKMTASQVYPEEFVSMLATVVLSAAGVQDIANAPAQ